MVREARQGDPDAARSRLAELAGVTLLDATEEAEQLARELIDSGAVPSNAAVDAAHIAIAVANRVDYLVTWNFRHIANAAMIAGVRAARDAYAALHGHDIAAIFEDVRAAQEASGRVYVRDIERLVQAATPVAGQVTAAVRQMERSLGPVLDRLNEWATAAAPFLEKWTRIAEAAVEATERIRPVVEEVREWIRIVDALDRIGWLPYRAAPFHYVEECGEDLALLDGRFAGYYRTRWIEIRDEMESGLAEYHIDDEASATFREALAAHEAGHYRCVCRLLFPEIERMIGAGHGGSNKMLEGLTGTGDLADFACKERFGYVLFGRLVNHAYERVMTDDELARFERDPVPNRHAAMHGLVSYSTHKHSMNMLILTDYVFRILPPLEESHT